MGTLRLAGLTIPPAPKRLEWASNADTDGQALVRSPLHDNRQCTMQVRVAASSMDAAMTALGTLQGKLQEACIQGAGNGPGLKFNWTPSEATHALAGYMVYGEITDLPVTYDDGWFANQPIVTVAFQCKPFLYGAEVTGPTASGTTPLLTVEVDSVPGDVPAEARLVVTDGTAQSRRWVEWGLESLYYNASSPPPLFVDSASVVTTGFAGVRSALTGAYGGSVVSTTLYDQTTSICGTGSLSHVGVFRVKARIWAASTDQYWRLSWQEGDGDFTANSFVQPVVTSDFSEIDLGIVTVEPVLSGTQLWTGRVEAYTTDTAGEVGAVDYLALIPANDGYGRIEGNYLYQPGGIVGFDNFELDDGGGTLNATVAPSGGTWASSGATTDFAGGPWHGSVALARATDSQTTYRFAVLGASTSADVETKIDYLGLSSLDLSKLEGFSGTVDMAAVARYTDANNHLRVNLNIPGSSGTLSIATVVGGTVTTLINGPVDLDPDGGDYSVRLVAYSTGQVIGEVLNISAGTSKSLLQLRATSSLVATGGTLASGKRGFGDRCNASSGEGITRHYDNFYMAMPAKEILAINSGRSLEIRSNSNLRQSADGSSYGDIPSRGSRLLIPQAGDAGRSSRIAVRAVREDPVEMASRNDSDTTQLAVFYTPRYLAVPRS